MSVYVCLPSSSSPSRPVLALVDCGASECFIDPNLVHALGLQLHTIRDPKRLRLADGLPRGLLTRGVSLETRLAPSSLVFPRITFLVTKLNDQFPIILGLPWLRENKVQIDFASNNLSFPDPAKLLDPEPSLAITPKSPSASRSLQPQLSPSTQAMPRTTRAHPASTNSNVTPVSNSLHQHHPYVSPSPLQRDAVLFNGSDNLLEGTYTPPTPSAGDSTHSAPLPSDIKSLQPHILSPSAFLRLATAGSLEVGVWNPDSDLDSTPSARLAPVFAFSPDDEDEDPDAASILAQLPPEYHDYSDVFSQVRADRLPPRRPYDHKIQLEAGRNPPAGRLYSMSETELKTLRDYIKNMVDKGFIRASTSPSASPVLFVKKKDGSLRLCVDYRALNEITIKNRYPIPLIGPLLDQFRSAKVFSKIDLRGAYHLLRIAEGDEWKTAFRTRYGSYEYLVMPFGLTNAPSSFQHLMHDKFMHLLDISVVIYLDDICIYSKDPAQHTAHVREVLNILRSSLLFAKVEKCEFSRDSIDFLGYRVSTRGVEMDPAKVSAVLAWSPPTSVKGIQSFLGFANFYRRFIKDYSHIASPLHKLTHKESPFTWSAECQAAFDRLKKIFTSAPVLAHFQPELPIIVETDASDYAIGAVISQHHGDILRPVAYHSRTMSAPELNYDIHDKELLAVRDCFGIWRHYLEGSQHTISVLSDHKNLEYFRTNKQLTRRQARWSEYLSEFDFVIEYRSGKLGGKPDALTRRDDFYPEGDAALARNAHNLRPALGSAHFRAMSVNFELDPDGLLEEILSAQSKDPQLQQHISNPVTPFFLGSKGELLRDGRLVVANDNALRIRLLKSYHDHPLSGHPGQAKTLELVTRNYFWPRMRKFIYAYVASCLACGRTKTSRHKPFGLLKSLPIPQRPWSSISTDFIDQLPVSNGFDSIWVVACRLTKMAIFIPTHTDLTTPQLAQLWIQHVFSKHGVPNDIVSDRGNKFRADFWREVAKALSLQHNLSTSFHPQSDGQTERINQSLEQYLRLYVSYDQSDWSSRLALAEWTYNNTIHSTTTVSPFFANYGYHPTLEINVQRIRSVAAKDFAQNLADVHAHCREQMRIAQTSQQHFANRLRLPSPKFTVGQRVWLNAQNIRVARPARKLADRRLGPFEIEAVVSPVAFRLKLTPELRSLHPVFHSSLLEPVQENTIPGRLQPPPPVIELDGSEEYEVDQILSSRLYYNRLQYRVQWTGYEDQPDYQTWEYAENLSHAPELVTNFHAANPDSPSPSSIAPSDSRARITPRTPSDISATPVSPNHALVAPPAEPPATRTSRTRTGVQLPARYRDRPL